MLYLLWETTLLLIACLFVNESELNKLNHSNENQLISYDVEEAWLPTYENNLSLNRESALKFG